MISLKKLYVALAILMPLLGLLCYAWLEEWIIIRHPGWQTQQNKTANTYIKKKITLFMWQNNQWLQEQNEIIWSQAHAYENVKQLVQATLTLFFEEEIIKKKVYIEAVLETADQTQFIIIFDRNPFSKQMSIRDKYFIIESILKTVRENGIKASKIGFLVNHQPLIDPHLDFSQSWPLEGFS